MPTVVMLTVPRPRAVVSVRAARRIVVPLSKDSAFEASSADAVREGEHIAIRLAKAAEPPGGIHALFKGYEAAIRSAARLTAVKRAPRIVLGLGGCSNAHDTDTNSQHKQQEPHSRLLGWPLSYKCLLSRFIPYPRAMRH